MSAESLLLNERDNAENGNVSPSTGRDCTLYHGSAACHRCIASSGRKDVDHDAFGWQGSVHTVQSVHFTCRASLPTTGHSLNAHDVPVRCRYTEAGA